ncbi:hypothetical protein NEIG_01609 [Nematocida sp. ERTm5]|nr:hypothetical protein NEIG_01609 [Nematocida sp. ERTm5]
MCINEKQNSKIQMHEGKNCVGCEECGRKKESKKISISDAFLSKARYTKSPTYYTNIGVDRANGVGASHISPSSFSSPSHFESGSLGGRESGGGRGRDMYFVPKEEGVFPSEVEFPKKIQKIEGISPGGVGSVMKNTGRESNSIGASSVYQKKVVAVPMTNSFSFNSVPSEDSWERGVSKRTNMPYASSNSALGGSGEGEVLRGAHLGIGGYGEREPSYQSIHYSSVFDQDNGGISIMNSSSMGVVGGGYNNDSPISDHRMHALESQGGSMGLHRRSPSMPRPQGVSGSAGGTFSSFSTPDAFNYLSANSSATSCNLSMGSEDSPRFLQGRSSYAMRGEGTEPIYNTLRQEPGVRAAYNPLTDTAYQTAQISQLKHKVILSDAIFPFIDFTLDFTKQHLLVNETLGLPRLQPHNTALTKNIMDMVISNGGLQIVDEKSMWGVIVKELGQKAEDTHKLRMYYIIVCYPYEQIIRIYKSASEVPQPIIIVYIEPKKADMLPEIINMVGQKKKKTEERPQISAKIVETSGILEIAVVMNEMYASGVRNSQELMETLIHMKSLTCTSGIVKSVFSCLDMALIEKQLRVIMVEWISKKVEDISSKDIPDVEKRIIQTYEEILGQSVDRCIEQQKGGDAEEAGNVGQDSDESQQEITARDLNRQDDSQTKQKRLCMKNYSEHDEVYVYPTIDICEEPVVPSGACTAHEHCAIYQHSRCPCGKSLVKFDTPADIYYSVLLFLAKSSSVSVSVNTISLLARLLETMPALMFSFKYKYIYKAMIILWNILKGQKSRSFLEAGGICTRLAGDGFSKLSREVSKLLSSPILSKQDILSVISNGQLEIIMKIANSPNGQSILSHTRVQRLAEIWRYLLFLVCSNFFSEKNAEFLETTLTSIDGLSVYLRCHLEKSSELSQVLGIMEIESGGWVLDVLSSDVFTDSVYLLCDFIFSANSLAAVPQTGHVLLQQ